MRAIKVFIVLLLSCVPVLGGETFITHKSGQTRIISYGLSYLVSDSKAASEEPAGENLVLSLRNIGAKWIRLDGVSTNNLNLQDAKGQVLKIYLMTLPREGIGCGMPAFIHLQVGHAGDAPQPWTLNFKSPDEM